MRRLLGVAAAALGSASLPTHIDGIELFVNANHPGDFHTRAGLYSAHDKWPSVFTMFSHLQQTVRIFFFITLLSAEPCDPRFGPTLSAMYFVL
jgi:hypothetical protein